MTEQMIRSAGVATGDEISDFHARFRPFVSRIYRNALTLTADPKSAEKLQTEVYLQAFLSYLHFDPMADFTDWLSEIIEACFSEWQSHNVPCS